MPTNSQGQSRSPQGAGQGQGHQQQGQQHNQQQGQTRNTKQDPARRVAESAQSTFASARQRVTDQIDCVVRAVERASDELKKDDQTGLASRAHQLARRAESASSYLQEKSPRELKNDLDDLARRKPAWFLSGAFVAGLAAARFLKSSERNQVTPSRIPGVGSGSRSGGGWGNTGAGAGGGGGRDYGAR